MPLYHPHNGPDDDDRLHPVVATINRIGQCTGAPLRAPCVNPYPRPSRRRWLLMLLVQLLSELLARVPSVQPCIDIANEPLRCKYMH